MLASMELALVVSVTIAMREREIMVIFSGKTAFADEDRRGKRREIRQKRTNNR